MAALKGPGLFHPGTAPNCTNLTRERCTQQPRKGLPKSTHSHSVPRHSPEASGHSVDQRTVAVRPDSMLHLRPGYILLGRPSDAASVLSERRQLFRELGARRSGKPGDRLGLEKTKRSSSDRTGPRNRRIFQGTIVSIGNMGLDLEPLAVPCAYLTLTG